MNKHRSLSSCAERNVFLCLTFAFAALMACPEIQAGPDDEIGNEKNDKFVDQDKIKLELRRIKSEQATKVKFLESKLRTRAAQLNINAQSISSLRSDIRASLRAYVYENRSTLVSGNFAIVNSQIMASLPTYASMSFAAYEMAEMQNRQGRLRLMRGAFENLNRQYVRESFELERLGLLEELINEGEQISVEMLKRPKSFITNEEQEALAGNSDKNEDNDSKIMFGYPKAGDYVTPKTKTLYLLKDESEADSLNLKPSLYSVPRLVTMVESKLAAKFEPSQVGEVLIEGEHLVKIRIDDPTGPSHNFVGWVSKERVVRYRKKDEKDNIPQLDKPFAMPGEGKPKNIVKLGGDDAKESPEPSAPSKNLVKLAGLPSVGSVITAKDIALIWKNNVDLKEYLDRNEDIDVRDNALKRREVDKIDDNVAARVQKIDQIGRDILLQINIESPTHPLNRTKWWVRSQDVSLCKISN